MSYLARMMKFHGDKKPSKKAEKASPSKGGKFQVYQRELKGLGIRLYTDDSDYIVNLIGEKNDSKAYFSDDLDDAYNTGKQMAAKAGKHSESASGKISSADEKKYPWAKGMRSKEFAEYQKIARFLGLKDGGYVALWLDDDLGSKEDEFFKALYSKIDKDLVEDADYENIYDAMLAIATGKTTTSYPGSKGIVEAYWDRHDKKGGKEKASYLDNVRGEKASISRWNKFFGKAQAKFFDEMDMPEEEAVVGTKVLTWPDIVPGTMIRTLKKLGFDVDGAKITNNGESVIVGKNGDARGCKLILSDAENASAPKKTSYLDSVRGETAADASEKQIATIKGFVAIAVKQVTAAKNKGDLDGSEDKRTDSLINIGGKLLRSVAKSLRIKISNADMLDDDTDCISASIVGKPSASVLQKVNAIGKHFQKFKGPISFGVTEEDNFTFLEMRYRGHDTASVQPNYLQRVNGETAAPRKKKPTARKLATKGKVVGNNKYVKGGVMATQAEKQRKQAGWHESQGIDADDAKYYEKIAKYISAQSDAIITGKDFLMWYGESKEYDQKVVDRVNRAVKKIMGPKLFDAAESQARVVAVLERMSGMKGDGDPLTEAYLKRWKQNVKQGGEIDPAKVDVKAVKAEARTIGKKNTGKVNYAAAKKVIQELVRAFGMKLMSWDGPLDFTPRVREAIITDFGLLEHDDALMDTIFKKVSTPHVLIVRNEDRITVQYSSSDEDKYEDD